MKDIAKITCPICNEEIYISRPVLNADDIAWGFSRFAYSCPKCGHPCAMTFDYFEKHLINLKIV